MGAEFNWGNGGNYVSMSEFPEEMFEMNIKELLSNLMNKIDRALEIRDRGTFDKLLTQYTALSMEV